MQEGVCISEALGGKCSEGVSSWQRVKRPTITALAVLALASVLPHESTAQVSSQASTAQTQVRHALSPEVLAMHSRLKRPVPTIPTDLELATSTGSNSTNFNTEQGPGFGPRAGLPGCDVFPAPASVGAAVGLSYFGPSPSTVNPSLVGPVQLLNSGRLDAIHGTITLPLYLGHMKGSGKNVWYILTDVDDSNVAAELGLNFSTKLTFASAATRTANFDANGDLVFDAGTVNFYLSTLPTCVKVTPIMRSHAAKRQVSYQLAQQGDLT